MLAALRTHSLRLLQLRLVVVQVVYHLSKSKTFLYSAHSHYVSRLSHPAKFIVCLDYLLKPHQISYSVECHVVLPWTIELIFDYQQYPSHLVGLLHKVDLIYIFFEVEFDLQFHYDSVDEFLVHLGHN